MASVIASSIMFPFNRGRSDFNSSLSGKKSAREIRAENSLGRSAIQTGSIPKNISEYEVYSGIWNGLLDRFFANAKMPNSHEGTLSALRDLDRYVKASTRKGDIEGIIRKILDDHPRVQELRAAELAWRTQNVDTLVEHTQSKAALAHLSNPTPTRRDTHSRAAPGVVGRFVRAFQTVMQ